MQRTSFCLHLANHRSRVIRLPVFYTNRTTVTGVAHLQCNCVVLCSDHIAFKCDTDYIASIGVCPRLAPLCRQQYFFDTDVNFPRTPGASSLSASRYFFCAEETPNA